MIKKEHSLWVEQYRSKTLEDYIGNEQLKSIVAQYIKKNDLQNLLLYGTPGTGKTTTIVNLINAYQNNFGLKNKDLIIHLNASDERGIDVIRNQINAFVTSKPLFNEGMKFVVLDEVDYMTKNAQQALRYLLQSYSDNVRFCLICNYISKIDIGLQNEFLKLRFNQLPKEDIIVFLNKISICENLNMSEEILQCVQQLYKSDIRSMVNFMQSNQDILDTHYHIIDKDVWETLIDNIKTSPLSK
jgi:replication factor C subunit 3/5